MRERVLGTRHDHLVAELARVADEVARAQGLELVELTVRGSSRRRVVRVDIDRAGLQGVDLDDCRRASDALGAVLDVSDLIDGEYTLEVSSPGLDRPVVSDDDIRRNTGRRVIVSTVEPIDGRREFRGVLLGSSDGSLIVDEEGTSVRIPRDRIDCARQDAGF